MSVTQPIQSYRHAMFLPFHLADPAGILFFGHVFSLAHEAYEHFVMNQLGYAWREWFENSDWIVPIKHTEADFLQPLHAGLSCEIEVLVDSLTTSSFTLVSRIDQPEICCLVKTVHVFCSRSTKRKIPMPAEINSKLTLLIQPSYQIP